MSDQSRPAPRPAAEEILDVVLIGGGIMSATLGAMLAELQPDWSMRLYERRDGLAEESSDPWNNAGTGHAGYCELNYMPDPADGAKAADISRQFLLSRQFWASLVAEGALPEAGDFVNPTPHMDLVFGAKDVAALRQRVETLRRSPLFATMEYSEDPAVIERWAPLTMRGRTGDEPVAASRIATGTDVDFGALSRGLIARSERSGAEVRTGHEVTRLRRQANGLWSLRVRDLATGRSHTARSRFVFVGAGGYALRMLQRAKLPEVRGYAVFPLGAQFLRCDTPEIVAQHEAKVYSQAAVGAPPMSVPHLDKRVVDGEGALLFGPYATFSTKLLKHGRLSDLFTTIRARNLPSLVGVGVQNLPLVGYLVRELLASRKRKLAELRRFYPEARDADWTLIDAGQRAQLIKPHPKKWGVLTFGTELVTGGGGSVAGLLGASPGASTAVPIMLELLETCFPEQWPDWRERLVTRIPGIDAPVDADRGTVDAVIEATAAALGLRQRSAAIG
ncbi:malate dehydrogenase (quinone) [Leucobacter sp. M11]|nr:malate dehydrogenase (quinone) [Leucobacter sp. M11]MEB4614717.1 malate dehydrogenase (quinone) [Leucobacter sp. M11]